VPIESLSAASPELSTSGDDQKTVAALANQTHYVESVADFIISFSRAIAKFNTVTCKSLVYLVHRKVQTPIE